jgi:PKD repeat protein
MPAANISVNGVDGSNTDLPINTLVQLNNQNIGGETTYTWSILDQPPGTADALSSTTIQNPTFTPKKEGTYLIKLVVNQGLGTEVEDKVVCAVRQLKTRRRVPAAGETTQADASDGWAVALNELQRDIDSLRADPGFVVGVVGAAGLSEGAICKVEAVEVLKSGLPGEERVPKFTRALATSSANVRGLLGILIQGVDGDTTPDSGAVAQFRIFGLTRPFTGTPVVGDAVFVNDAGDFSLTEGTFRRVVGFVAEVSGGQYRIWFDGRLLDVNPWFNTLDIPNTSTGVGAAGKSRLRANGDRLQVSDNAAAYRNVMRADDDAPLNSVELPNSSSGVGSAGKSKLRANGDRLQVSDNGAAYRNLIRADDDAPLNSVEIPNSSTGVSGAGKVKFRSNGDRAQFSENGGSYVNILSEIKAGPTVLAWGNNGTTADTTAYFLDPFYASRTAGTGEVKFQVPSVGKIAKLRVRALTGPATQGQQVTVRKNGSDQTLTVLLAAGATSASDLVNSFAVAAGDDLSVKIQGISGITTGVTEIMVTVEYTVQ